MTTTKNSFRQICDKPCANKILQAEWSPQRDLVALVTSNGDIRLHRLYWQKVWVVQSKENHPTCLTWNNDGSILAVGYQDGKISLYEIEKNNVIHSFSCESQIISLFWFSQKKTGIDENGTCYKDLSDDFYPDIDKEELLKKLEKINLLISNENYSILVVGTCDGKLHLYVDGVFPVVKLNIGQLTERNMTISDVLCSRLDLKTGQLPVVCLAKQENKESNSFFMFNYTSSLFGSRGNEISFLSTKLTRISNLLNHCEKVLKQMADAAEDIYLKINSKLEKLDDLIVGTGSSVAAEFTIAYATGISSAELQAFLTQNLTTKGLKQIAQSVQAGYSSLHNDVKDELELLATHLLFLFVELNGMSQWFERFAILGLSTEAVQQCITFLVQFIMKGQELLKVIADDMNNFKVFFNWLAKLVFEVSGEQSQLLSNQMSNEDFDVMLDFLEYRLQKVVKNNKSGYDLERVSQFLHEQSNECSTIFIKDNDWYKYVENNENLRNLPCIIKPDTTSTLLQIFQQLKKSTADIFDSICTTMTESFTLTGTVNLFQQATDHDESCSSIFSFHSTTPSSLILSMLPCTCDAESFFILKYNISTDVQLNSFCINPTSQDAGSMQNDVSLNSSVDPDQYVFTLRDMKFYNDKFITLLFDEEDKNEDRASTSFGQIPLDSILNAESVSIKPTVTQGVLDQEEVSIPSLNVSSLFTEQRRMESFRGKHLVVNGYSREVACVVSMSGRRVRVFDMTAEDDDADDSKLIEDDSKLETTNLEEENIDSQ